MREYNRKFRRKIQHYALMLQYPLTSYVSSMKILSEMNLLSNPKL